MNTALVDTVLVDAEPFNGALSDFVDTPSEIGLPPFDMDGRSILDIGCATGKELQHPVYARAALRCGIDPDPRAISTGQSRYPHLSLRCGKAEQLPFESTTFDAVTCRTAMPFMDIPIALAEMNRVMKPGGYLLLTLHDWRMHFGWMWKAVCGGHVKRLLDCIWMFWPSFVFAAFGTVPPRPWGGHWKATRETFQTRAGIRAALYKAGFESIGVERTEQLFIVRAWKPT